jgi:hypothetical protein
MFSSTKRVTRGQCSCCGEPKKQEGREDQKFFVLDIKDIENVKTFQGNWEPKLIESDSDFAICLKCWKFIGLYIANHVRVEKYE